MKSERALPHQRDQKPLSSRNWTQLQSIGSLEETQVDRPISARNSHGLHPGMWVQRKSELKDINKSSIWERKRPMTAKYRKAPTNQPTRVLIKPIEMATEALNRYRCDRPMSARVCTLNAPDKNFTGSEAVIRPFGQEISRTSSPGPIDLTLRTQQLETSKPLSCKR